LGSATKAMHLLIFTTCLLVYFLPFVCALSRNKRNSGAIFALNLLLGWTFIGWVVALVWALTADTPVPVP
jgi:hypothetical protein